mgnify:CR=1 FL=1
MDIKKSSYYDELAASIPDELGAAILSILTQAGVGRRNALGRGELTFAVQGKGYGVHERQVRYCIHDLRRAGHLICSAPGAGGGYYLAANRTEFEEFCQRELHPKALDMLETEKAMKASARQQFGEAVQLGLI